MYCVSVYGSCGETQLHRIQKLLNFCARVICGRRKYEHISDVLCQLKWLRAEQLVSYTDFVWSKQLWRLAYLQTLPQCSRTCQRHTKLDQAGQLNCPRAKTGSGVRRLAHCSAVFNRLPGNLQCLTGPAFKRQLKRLLLREAEAR